MGRLLAVVLALGACVSPDEDNGPTGDPQADAGIEGDAEPPLSAVALAATHNSYSGGDRGAILEQLIGGVRVLELDVHDNDFAAYGYRLGHDAPGDEVDHDATNPESDRLRDWLDVIAEFSRAHPDHAPIVVTLDAKDDLTDNPSWAEGEIGQLARVVADRFGDALLRADDVAGGWPAAGALRGRIAVALSGDHRSRLQYRRAAGFHPAIAVNAAGQVVLAHDDGGGRLWAWTGQIDGDQVRWQRRSRYDTGLDPAIVLSDDGLIVEVHEDQDDDKLWYRLGQLDDRGVIDWFAAGGTTFPDDDTGRDPSLAFTSAGGLAVREIHRSPSSGDPFYWNGSIDVANRTVVWTRAGDGGASGDPPYDVTASSAGAHTVAVTAGGLEGYSDDALGVAVGAGAAAPVRYPQILFVDAHPSSSAQLRLDPGVHFFTADARDADARAWAAERRREGKLVRLYGFEDPGQAIDPAASFAATDHPFSTWHRDYCDQQACLDW